ncbi:MAG: zf-TFIIB domain-containing protein [Rhizomicrobium sp.]
MKCPNCNTELAPAKQSGVDIELCQTCKGMWLTRQELNALEDEVFDLGDDEKGTLVFGSTADRRACPQCGKPMNRFEYRFYDLEMDFCGEGHGFWLEAGEDKRVLELMKKEEAGLERKVLAEDKWSKTMRHLRAGSFIDRLRSMFR